MLVKLGTENASRNDEVKFLLGISFCLASQYWVVSMTLQSFGFLLAWIVSGSIGCMDPFLINSDVSAWLLLFLFLSRVLES